METPNQVTQQWKWFKDMFAERWMGNTQFRRPNVKLRPGLSMSEIFIRYAATVVLVDRGYIAEVMLPSEPGKSYFPCALFLDSQTARKWCEDFVQLHHDNLPLPEHYIGPTRN